MGQDSIAIADVAGTETRDLFYGMLGRQDKLPGTLDHPERDSSIVAAVRPAIT